MFLTDYKLGSFFPWMWFDCKISNVPAEVGVADRNSFSPMCHPLVNSRIKLLHKDFPSLSDLLGHIPSSNLSVWIGLHYCHQLKFWPSHHHLTFLWHDLNGFWWHSNIKSIFCQYKTCSVAKITKHLKLSNFIFWMHFPLHPTCQTKSFLLPTGTNRPHSIQSEKQDWFNAINFFSYYSCNSASLNTQGNMFL